MFFVVGYSVWVLKAATFKRFSVRPCWSPILLREQNSIAGVFQCIFNKISEQVFYITTVNWYIGTKKWRCKYWSSIVCLSEELLQKRQKFRSFNFFYIKVSFLHHFWGLCLKNAVDQEKQQKYSFCWKRMKIIFFGETKWCSTKMLVKITKEFTFVNRTVLNLCWTVSNALFYILWK